MTSLEDELRRQLTVNANLRATVAATEARVADLTGRLHVDEQLSELRYAVKEGITSERVKYVSGREGSVLDGVPGVSCAVVSGGRR